MQDSITIEDRSEAAQDKLLAFFNERIRKMSPRELARFEKKADKIVEKVKGRAESAGSHETAESDLKASRA